MGGIGEGQEWGVGWIEEMEGKVKEAGGVEEVEEGRKELGEWVVLVEGVGREQWDMALTERLGRLWLGWVVNEE